MAANVENMFSVREVPWHGLGTVVTEAPTSADAIKMAGLDWDVVQRDLYFPDNCFTKVPGFKVNLRETDNAVLGVVKDRYRIVQNKDAFAFCDALLGEGVKFETAGSLAGGKRNFILAQMPEKYKLLDDEVTPYMVMTNGHDGCHGVSVAMTPVRVVCQNTLNLALARAKRRWNTTHTGDIEYKLDEALRALGMGQQYMSELQKEAEVLHGIKFDDDKTMKYIEMLLPVNENGTKRVQENVKNLQRLLMQVYLSTEDLQHLDKGAYRFINAVSDFATHTPPQRKTANYQERLFSKTIDGNTLIDRAYTMMSSLV